MIVRPISCPDFYPDYPNQKPVQGPFRVVPVNVPVWPQPTWPRPDRISPLPDDIWWPTPAPQTPEDREVERLRRMERELNEREAEARRREQARQEAEQIRQRLRRRGVPESQLGRGAPGQLGSPLTIDDVLGALPQNKVG